SCEICGETAKNIVVAGDAGFMEEWNERDVGDYSSGAHQLFSAPATKGIFCTCPAIESYFVQ
ncbi:hypothetical protein SUGI_0782600, partial [Cryptomeria japonica]